MNYNNITQQQLISGILQCKKCLSLITKASRIDEFYQIDGNIPSINKTDQKYIFQSENSDSNPISELCVYEGLLCKNCKTEIGRLFIATTEMYDSIRMKQLVYESSIQCQVIDLKQNYDLDICEIIDLSEQNSNPIIMQSNNQMIGESHNSSRRQSINYLTRDPKQMSDNRNSISQIKLKKENDEQDENVQESINQINTSVQSFEQSLINFDERIGNSETQLEYLNDKIRDLIRICKQMKNQNNQSPLIRNQQYQQELNSTPVMQRNQFEGYTQSAQYHNPKFSYKREYYD